MMKRTIDGAIPGCAAIGTLPIVVTAIPLPPSLVEFAGYWVAWWWCLAIGLSFTSITIGVVISKHHPRQAFPLQAIPLSFVGIIFAIHAVGLFWANGWTAWASGWWEIGLIIYFFARAYEVWKALRMAKQQAASAELAEEG
jgi:hypothetical protein